MESIHLFFGGTVQNLSLIRTHRLVHTQKNQVTLFFLYERSPNYFTIWGICRFWGILSQYLRSQGAVKKRFQLADATNGLAVNNGCCSLNRTELQNG